MLGTHANLFVLFVCGCAFVAAHFHSSLPPLSPPFTTTQCPPNRRNRKVRYPESVKRPTPTSSRLNAHDAAKGTTPRNNTTTSRSTKTSRTTTTSQSITSLSWWTTTTGSSTRTTTISRSTTSATTSMTTTSMTTTTSTTTTRRTRTRTRTTRCPRRERGLKRRATGKGGIVRSRKAPHPGTYTSHPIAIALNVMLPGKPPSIGLAMTWQPPIPANSHCEFARFYIYLLLYNHSFFLGRNVYL